MYRQKVSIFCLLLIYNGLLEGVVYMNKKMVKTLKIGVVILIIIAIIICIVILKNKDNERKNQVTIDNLPEVEYTEDEAKDFYTKNLIKHLDTFQNDFHIKYIAKSINEAGEELVSTEEFSKKGDRMAVYIAEDNFRIIIDKDYFYHVDENDYYIYKFKKEQNINTNMDVLFYSLKNINENFLKTGYEVLDDVKYYFEEYTMDSDDTVLIRYYFDADNNIKFIKAYKENSKVQTFMEIQMLEKIAYDFMFDMGDKYELVEVSEK